ncbi:glyoxalase superfamily protein [Pseudomonas sp. NPDC089428]
MHIHFSERHGDARPGTTLFVPVLNIEGFRDGLLTKRYGSSRSPSSA